MSNDTSIVMNGVRWVPYDWVEQRSKELVSAEIENLRKQLDQRDARISELCSGTVKPPVTPAMCHDCMKHLDGPHCTQCKFWYELLMKTAKAYGFSGGGLNPGGAYLVHPEYGDLQLSGQNDEYDFHILLAFVAKHGLKAMPEGPK